MRQIGATLTANPRRTLFQVRRVKPLLSCGRVDAAQDDSPPSLRYAAGWPRGHRNSSCGRSFWRARPAVFRSWEEVAERALVQVPILEVCYTCIAYLDGADNWATLQSQSS